MDEQAPRQKTAVLKLELESQAVIALLEGVSAVHASVEAMRADVARLVALSVPAEFSETYRAHVE